MKKIGKINLAALGDKQFTNQELLCIKGGYSDKCCGCGCPYNNDAANQDANWNNGYSSSIGGGAYWCYENEMGIPIRVGLCV